MIKKVLFLVMVAAMLFSCQKEEMNDCGCDVGNTRPTKVVINGQIEECVTTGSTENKVVMEGGYVTGGGIYDGEKDVQVEAHPNEGYEIDYFYGGPETAESKKYNYTNKGETSFFVNLDNQDHYFECKFKKAEKKYKLTVTSTTHGTVEGSGNYKAGETVTIKATPMPGYVFIGWVETEVAGKNYYSAVSQEATAKISITEESRTVKAIFRPKTVNLTLSFKGWYGQGTYNEHYVYNIKSDCTDPDEEPDFLEINVYDNNLVDYTVLSWGDNPVYINGYEEGTYANTYYMSIGDTIFETVETESATCNAVLQWISKKVTLNGVTYNLENTVQTP